MSAPDALVSHRVGIGADCADIWLLLVLIDSLRLDTLLAYLCFKFIQVIEESLNHIWIENGAASFLQHRDRFVVGHRLAVLPVLAHGVEAVGQRKYSGCSRNLISAQSVRIAAPVPALVMVTDYRNDGIRKPDSFEYLGADDRVNFHLFKLGRRQAVWLVQNVIGHGELADVVQQ